MKQTVTIATPDQLRPLMLAAFTAIQGLVSAGKVVCFTFSEKKRSLAANNRMWAMLTDVSDQVDWYGEKLLPVEWKDIFTASLKKQKAVPGIEGGFVVLGARTSEMSGPEISELMALIEAFGSDKEVRFQS
jgi:hypothetical protein